MSAAFAWWCVQLLPSATAENVILSIVKKARHNRSNLRCLARLVLQLLAKFFFIFLMWNKRRLVQDEQKNCSISHAEVGSNLTTCKS